MVVKRYGNEDMWSNSELVNFVYLKVVFFAEPKYEWSFLSSTSFLHDESQKSKIFENIFEFRQ